MTSQLGRLRQWAGEVMASKENKMFVSDEFKDLEAEIDMRKEGIAKIQYASEAYHRSLSKKKQYEGLDNNEKIMPLDALGLIMIVHGEGFGENSPFGASLVKFGRAHCKIATLQEAYAVTFKDTFITSLQRSGDGIKEFEYLNKKLESRRSAYESAHLKAEKLKQSKKEKEKERLEAEEEVDRTKQRFDETSEDIRAHMELIRDDDSYHLRDLTTFLDLEINFAQQYLEVLKDVKSDWTYENSSPNTSKPSGPLRSLSRRSSGKDKSPISTNSSPDSSDDGDGPRSGSDRRSSLREPGSGGSRPPSRPTSRLSRKRTNSNATATSDKDKENLSQQQSRRRSVAGWASSAVESVTSRRKKDKDNFATLDDEDEGEGTGRGSSERMSSLRKSSSIGSLGRRSPYVSSPKVTPQMTRAGAVPGRKVARARSDYEAKSSNELSFTAGSEIIVLNEVLDSWWMGELNNRRGLFPTTHIELIGPSKVLPTPPAQAEKSISPGLIANNGLEAVRDSDTHSLDDGYGTSELDEERDLTSRPMEHSPFIEGLGDTRSITSLTTDDEDYSVTPHTPKQNPRGLPVNTPPSRSASSTPPEPALLSAAGYLGRNPSSQESFTPTMQTPAKKVPPPPPPRRHTSSAPALAPPLPERRANVSGGLNKGYTSYSATTSSASSLASVSGSGSGSSGEGYDRSPFESTLDLSVPPQLPVRPADGVDGTNPFRRV